MPEDALTVALEVSNLMAEFARRRANGCAGGIKPDGRIRPEAR